MIDRYEILFSEFGESALKWPLIEHGAIVNTSAFSADTTAQRLEDSHPHSSARTRTIEDYQEGIPTTENLTSKLKRYIC